MTDRSGPSGMNPVWTLVVSGLTVFMAALDNLVVITALPAIQKDLGTSLQDLEWTVNGYTLTFSVFLMAGAAAGDRFGRRRVFLAGLVVFTGASAAAALLAMAGRAEVDLTLDHFDRLGAGSDLLVDLMPSGRYLMEDFFEAGGLPAVMARMLDRLDSNALTVTGKSVGENVADAECWNDEVIRQVDNPVKKDVGLAVLTGNLAPNGAIIKPSAASPDLLSHRGRAVVFESVEDLNARIDDPELDIDESCVLVLKGAGPRGYPGMPEIGNLPIPRRLLEKGVRDMVRVSDARMSGTSFGTVVLHVAPESAAGGPLAIVRDGDIIELDVPARRLHLDVPEAEIAARLDRLQLPAPSSKSGYERLYVEHVQQADVGVDFDFLVGQRSSFVARDNHV
ncbi:MFS transporter [Streptomyces asiaticus]